jgi:tagatose 1,6-diphosphate aldolase
MFYSLDKHTAVDSAIFAEERPALVIETVRRLSALEPHILKVPFPCDAKFKPNITDWKSDCAALNKACAVPWALLSGGDPFDVFKRQLQVACESGCSGFMAGRALWREAVSLPSEQRDAFLRGTVLSRFRELAEITSQFGNSWMSRHNMPIVDEAWYRTY